MRMRELVMWVSMTVATAAGCGEDTGDDAADAGGDGAGGAVETDRSAFPKCDAVEAYARFEVAGASTLSVDWGGADLIACRGADFPSAHTLDFTGGPLGAASWATVRLPGDEALAVGAVNDVDVLIGLAEPDLDLFWRGCSGEITEITPEIGRTDIGGPAVVVIDAVVGTVHCDTPATPIMSEDEYTLPTMAFRGVLSRVAPR